MSKLDQAMTAYAASPTEANRAAIVEACAREIATLKAHIVQQEESLRAAARMRLAEGVRDGWKLVPVEPTMPMIVAIEQKIDEQLNASGMFPGDMQRQDGSDIYERLLAAAPTPPTAAPAKDTPESMAASNARFAIDGAIQYGRENRNEPPSAEHWLYEYWNIGRQLATLGATGWDNVTPATAPPCAFCGLVGEHDYAYPHPSKPSYAAAPAPIQSAEFDLRNVTKIDRSSDMGVTITFASCRAASQFAKELDAALAAPAATAQASSEPVCTYCDGAKGWGHGEDAEACGQCDGSGTAHQQEQAKPTDLQALTDAADLSTKQGKLLALADRIDHEKLWRMAGMDHHKLTDEQKDRMNAAVALRRYADIWTPGHWVIVPPTGGIQFGASTLEKAVEMTKRDQARRLSAATPEQKG